MSQHIRSVLNLKGNKVYYNSKPVISTLEESIKKEARQHILMEPGRIKRDD
jgi:hypothetical protein